MTEPILIQINWIYFLGLIGSLVAFAWYTSARFTALETSMTWVKDILKDLKTSADNAANPAFAARSPVNLNSTGETWIVKSGLKEYIDTHREDFLDQCHEKKETNPYEVQKYVFKLFDEIQFEADFEDTLKKFAFENGTTMSVIRRIGGIYLRNICLESFGMNTDDIDSMGVLQYPGNS